MFAGLVANELDWSEKFTPSWQRLVLDGPPNIPHLHMTDTRSKEWKKKHGLTDREVGIRLDRAVSIIGDAEWLFPIGLKVSGAHVQDAFRDAKVKLSPRKISRFEPDYLCFLGYALLALNYVSKEHPECEKLDFMIELNGQITDFIKVFHSDMHDRLIDLGQPELACLVGELLPVGKDRAPVQAADVLCWHTAKSKIFMDADELRRYKKLARKAGILQTLDIETVAELADLLLKKTDNE